MTLFYFVKNLRQIIFFLDENLDETAVMKRQWGITFYILMVPIIWQVL